MSALCKAVISFCTVCAYISSALNKQTLTHFKQRYNSCKDITFQHHHQHIASPRPQLNWSLNLGCHTTLKHINQATVSFNMADHRQVYDYGPKNQLPSFELPNRRIEVKVKLTKVVNTVLQALQKDLRQHNMETVTLDQDTNTITVAGYPPVNGFNDVTVLYIVKRHDPEATILSSNLL